MHVKGKRRKSDWFCLRCRRSLVNSDKRRDTVSPKFRTPDAEPFFQHDQCGGAVDAGR